MNDVIKGYIGKEDFLLQTNTNAPEQFQRLLSVGGTGNFTKFPDLWDGTGKINVAALVSLLSTLTTANITNGNISTLTMKSPWVSITHPDFAADPTGVSDSIIPINNAITALASTGGTVILPLGSFRTTAPIIQKSGVNIIGVSKKGSKILPDGNFAAIDIADDASKSQFTIQRFTIDYGSTSSNPLAIGVKIGADASFYGFDFLIDDLYIKDACTAISDASPSFNYKLRRIHSYTTGGTAFSIKAFGASAKTLVNLEHCYAQACYAGFDMSGIHSLKMNHCTADTCTTNPMFFTACGGELSVCHLEGNVILEDAASPMVLNVSAGNLLLNGCFLTGNTINASAGAQSFLIHAASGAIVTLMNCRDGATIANDSGGGQYVFTLGADATSKIVSIQSSWPAPTGTAPYLFCNNYSAHNVEIRDNDIGTLADSATPSVMGHDRWLTGGTTTITDLTDGYRGQEIKIISEHAITITDGTNIFLAGSANFVMAATDTLTLIQKADGKWYELSRSVN